MIKIIKGGTPEFPNKKLLDLHVLTYDDICSYFGHINRMRDDRYQLYFVAEERTYHHADGASSFIKSSFDEAVERLKESFPNHECVLGMIVDEKFKADKNGSIRKIQRDCKENESKAGGVLCQSR
jgi:hypothetical protein